MNFCIFPGTFNPIHDGHLKMAEFALKKYSFDKIILIGNEFSFAQNMQNENFKWFSTTIEAKDFLTNYNITVIFIFCVQIDPFTQIRTGLDGDAALTAGDQRHVIGKGNVVTQRDELRIDDFDACADPYVAAHMLEGFAVVGKAHCGGIVRSVMEDDRFIKTLFVRVGHGSKGIGEKTLHKDLLFALADIRPGRYTHRLFKQP